jgi:hypothetical protein
LYQPHKLDDDNECGAVGGIKIGEGKRKYSEKKAALDHFVHHKSHMT